MVREDAITLYGFADAAERDWYRLLTAIQGVGPKVALALLSTLSPADLAAALMSINAVKGVEIGEGFAAAALSGEENADEMRMGAEGEVLFSANHAGGILGGISTGQPVVARFAVKPTSSSGSPAAPSSAARRSASVR